MPGSLFNLGRYVNKTASNADTSAASNNSAPNNPADETAPIEQSTIPPSSSLPDNQTSNAATTSVNTDVSKPLDQKDSSTQIQKHTNMDILSRLTARTNKCLVDAVNKAKEYKSAYADSEYVLWGLLQDSGVYQVLAATKVVPSELVKEVEASFKSGTSSDSPQFSPRVKKALEFGLSTARKTGYDFMSPEHLLIGLLQEGEGLAAQILSKHGVTIEAIQKKTGASAGEKEGDKKESAEDKSSALEDFCIDITARAKAGKLDPVVGRSKEIERMMHILSRRTKNNPVLIGEAGVGKTAIVEGLAGRIAIGDVPDPLKNKRILSLDLMSLLAGASHRGDFEKRFKKLLSEIEKNQGTIILFIDELHNLVGAGGSDGAMDASNIIKPLLARGELQTIGTTTVVEYRKHIEKDRALERRFQPILVDEPTPDVAIEMLRALKDKYEAFHKVSISDDAIEAAVRLSARYIGDRFLPDKAIDLIDEAASAVRMPAISLPEEIKSLESESTRLQAETIEAQKLNNKLQVDSLTKELEVLRVQIAEKTKEFETKKGATTSSVTPDVIAQTVSRWTGIPVSRMTESESEKLISLEDRIHKQLIDQEEAVSAVSESVRRGRAGLTSQKRPIGSFVFMGPTGVGKTELAKVLAQLLFGSSDMMVRLDMTEYMQQHEVAKLIGAPPGYIGYDEGGQLTEAVRKKPYSVVLLDEVEKAHPDVFNILLQILDDGRLTDNKGRTISFKNTILICTSNIGTSLIQTMLLGKSVDENVIDLPELSVLDTYVISPSGREIVTKGKIVWERQKSTTSTGNAWKQSSIPDYFAGQYVKSFEALSSTQAFPIESFNTHAVFPSGEEVVTAGDSLWRRTSTSVKEWQKSTLVDYVKDSVVINAKPDNPQDQLPTASWETHAVTPSEGEIVTHGDSVWIRDSLRDPNWRVLKKAMYLQELSNVQKPTQVRTPTALKWNSHVFTPSGEEMVITGDKLWKRAQNIWQKESLSAYFAGENNPVGENEKKEQDEIAQTGTYENLTKKLMGELRKVFKPELINRFDEILMFKPLTAIHMRAIVDLNLEVLGKTLQDEGYGITISDKARQELAIQGYDPVYGARPLRRTISRLIENPIATLVIKKEIKNGESIVVDYDSTKELFTFSIQKYEPVQNQALPQSSVQAPDQKPTEKNTTLEKDPTSPNNNTTVLATPADGQKNISNLPPDTVKSMIAEELSEALVENDKNTDISNNKASVAQKLYTDTQPSAIPHFNESINTNNVSSAPAVSV